MQKQANESTERIRNLEKALLESEKKAAIGLTMASIVHEINNPIQAMQNCLYLLGRKELSDEKKSVYLSMAQDSLDQLMTSVHKMVELYKGGMILRKVLDINDIINNVLESHTSQLKNQRITIHVTLFDQLPKVFVNAEQINQVVSNLIMNAIEAMPEGGELWIETMPERDKVVLSIEDTGGGIASELREKVFEPFYSTKTNGLGIGLPISTAIIESYGGSMVLADTHHRGARFLIKIPAGV